MDVMAENPGEMVLPVEEVGDSQNTESTLVNRRQKRLSKREHRWLAESSNAVVCPNFHLHKLNRRLNKPDGSPTVVAWIIRVACALTGIVTLVLGDMTGAFTVAARLNPAARWPGGGSNLCSSLNLCGRWQMNPGLACELQPWPSHWHGDRAATTLRSKQSQLSVQSKFTNATSC